MTIAERYANELWVCHLGIVPYGAALAMQTATRARRQAGELPDTLLLLEHPPVYTRGRRSGGEDLPFSEAFYRDRGIEIHDVDRGGRITYHGPGQLVGYPIMSVDDVGRFVRTMETALVDALAAELVVAHARPQDGPDFTGVWVEDEDGGEGGNQIRKIASIGVHVQRGVSTHGFAVNVHNDLEPFGWIVACGLPGVQMTSLERERPDPPAGEEQTCAARLRCFRRRAADGFARAHGRRQRLVTPQRLGFDRGPRPRRASERAPSTPAHQALAR
ncbi:MAG TPA: lipoyl(octanoyl) transferase LipB [Solirubrobacteraceae bacterium]|jgi:lipoyl(octanoyl) transferase|nr:lipoyl(octanoyl) transferase LipB [Solirubrobacteraceae bacterium]